MILTIIDDVFQFTSATEKNKKNSNNMVSSNFTGRWAYNGDGLFSGGGVGGLKTGVCFLFTG